MKMMMTTIMIKATMIFLLIQNRDISTTVMCIHCTMDRLSVVFVQIPRIFKFHIYSFQCKRKYKLWFLEFSQFAADIAFEFSINFIDEYCWFSLLMRFLILRYWENLYSVMIVRGEGDEMKWCKVSNNHENCVDSWKKKLKRNSVASRIFIYDEYAG